MNCKYIDQALVKGRLPWPLPHEAEDHLKGCKRCRELVRALSVPVPEEAPSPAILRQIEGGLVADLRFCSDFKIGIPGQTTGHVFEQARRSQLWRLSRYGSFCAGALSFLQV